LSKIKEEAKVVQVFRPAKQEAKGKKVMCDVYQITEPTR